MIFSKSPVKSVVEKINPVSKRGRITSLKFERKADYRTFLRYVKNNTKDLEKLSEKSDDKVDKKGSGLLGGLILLALFGGGAGGSGQKDEGGINKLSLLNKAIFKAKADDKRFKSQREKTTRLKSIIGANRGIKKLRDFLTNRKNIKLRKLNFAKVKNFAKNLKPNIVKARKVSLSKIRNFARQLKEISALREARRIEKVQKNVRVKVGSNVEGTPGGPTGGRNINKINKTKFFQQELLDDNQGKIGFTSKSEKERFKQLLKDQEKLKKTLKQKVNRMDSLLDLSVDKTQIESDKQLELLEQDPEFQKELKKIQNDELEKNLRKLEDPKIKKKRIDFLKFNRRVDRLTKILFPFARFIANPNRYLQFEFIKETIEAKPFADGTLTGVMDIKGRLPGDEGYDESTKGQYVKPVNIFIPSFEGNQSTIPFDTSLDFRPLVSVPKDLQSPSNNIIVDYEFTSSDDLFFMKMAGN